MTDKIKLIQCYKCFQISDHLRNACPHYFEPPVCANCGIFGHKYPQCQNVQYCLNCGGGHSVTARCCPVYRDKFKKIKSELLTDLLANTPAEELQTIINSLQPPVLHKIQAAVNNTTAGSVVTEDDEKSLSYSNQQVLDILESSASASNSANQFLEALFFKFKSNTPENYRSTHSSCESDDLSTDSSVHDPRIYPSLPNVPASKPQKITSSDSRLYTSPKPLHPALSRSCVTVPARLELARGGAPKKIPFYFSHESLDEIVLVPQGSLRLDKAENGTETIDSTTPETLNTLENILIRCNDRANSLIERQEAKIDANNNCLTPDPHIKLNKRSSPHWKFKN